MAGDVAGQGLAALVGRTRCLLLDFDGPVCGVFANHPARTIAAGLRQLLAERGVRMPTQVRDDPDPLAVLRYAATLDRGDLTRDVDDALRAAELLAVGSATPTRYARAVIAAAGDRGRLVAVVSNNAAGAIDAYLAGQRLTERVSVVVGRPYADPDRMKPDPTPVLLAMRALGAGPTECLLVGDSIGDVLAGRAAHVPVVGYANRPGKAVRLADVGADTVITSMAELARALRGAAAPVASWERGGRVQGPTGAPAATS